MLRDHAHHTVFTDGFYKDEGRDFAVRLLLGYCFSGGADAGEVLATIAECRDGHDREWSNAWLELGRRLVADADASAANGHRVSAASAYLRAANYLSQAFDGLDGVAERLPVFAEHRAAWEKFVDNGDFTAQRLAIPYEDTTLPGWFLAPAHDWSGATLVTINGSDGSVSAMWSAAAFGALRRGLAVVLFDGPGQQSMLFERGVGFRPDWEAVLTPVTDHVLTLPGVDPARLALYGISQAGYWVPRSLAFEHRYAAAVADPGVVDVQSSWLAPMPKHLHDLLAAGNAKAFNRDLGLGLKASPETRRIWDWRARPYRQSDSEATYFDTLQAVGEYTIGPEIAAQISTPLLITDPEDEQFWPGQSDELAARCADGIATIARFSASQGANFHCQPLARALTDERMFDWLDEKLAG
ncbi:hypothetical protein GOARA_013_00880 [Gordonia araii NBRC 100433]|uniref:Dipeptidyl aminopeptidase n=1 Tax=Gordonia araii NBRC 100433 TaxID=1073574 RepID=G7GYG9_9ACTN|nr:hypothetical protein [Gordonia araii]NNG97359.1 dipeptidyl aminopeptidase [Gordonia araii NBRC 100433]GAB08644.1 hypothetical protein GOARA_013_00880 [Gordonia araii NBRC 100433]